MEDPFKAFDARQEFRINDFAASDRSPLSEIAGVIA